ncbi:BEACH domain-containing protein [Naegleria gruberi]|uniref:BEACH domain-containing protein n=1 Tax=Naegleria gruberi TaxID=5762 RepID=D2VLR1_NAEGR|nr:BEACH domain-containing protein [Naegleria gruberi]EFC42183.1 BEACH domain-containing protein [Naegleria gruberi]|eukprot:XP_002674927.1 BEACH domain-containing protein [Naegleria gruberi strain NEG-M]
MLRKRKNKRFNMLLLKEDEIYFQDFSCTYYFGASGREKYKGRLHFCSQSLVFVPDDTRFSITRHCFDKIEGGFKKFKATSMNHPYFASFADENLFCFNCSEFVEIRKGNKDHPFIFKKQTETVVIGLTFLTAQQFVEKVTPIYQLFQSNSGLPSVEQINQIYEDQIAKGFSFDVTWLEDFREQTLYETHGTKVTPLVDTHGCILLTNERIYFQPFNNISTKPVKKYNLRDINRIVRRRHNLRHIGIEVFMQNNKSIFLAVKNQTERDNIYNIILKQPIISNISLNDQGNMTLKWQSGLISNFDYLLYLNFIADRSFNDLTQYPVFPWVIADYTSKTLDLNNPNTFRDLRKPIGALNPNRLEGFKQRYYDMPDPKFLYGTHYSTPGYVLYFLLRQAPEYMLKLQNGRFDAPDREFFSIQSTYNSVLSNTADLKELIPEFYQSTGSFLINSLNLDLGVRNNGQRVNNVILPPWAKDEQEFVYKCRLALESDHVSQNLHHWIDLIFGYKQIGEEAVKADNLFYYLTYEGAIDIEKIRDPVQRRGIEIQIREFGQTPRQVFNHPHPQRKTGTNLSNITKFSVTSSDVIPLDIISATKEVVPKSPARSYSSSLLMESFSNTSSKSSSPVVRSVSSPFSPIITPKDDDFDISDMLKTDLNRPSSFMLSKISEESFSNNEDESLSSSISLDSLGDNSPRTRKKRSKLRKQKSMSQVSEFMPKYSTSDDISFKVDLHRDRITSAIISKDKSRIYTSSDDSTCKVYSIESKRQLRRIADMGDMALSSCAVIEDPNSEQKVLIAGSWDNRVYVYSVEYGKVLDILEGHEDAVSKICISGDSLISSSWDSTVKVWKCSSDSVSTTPLATFQEHDSPVHSLNIDTSGNMIVSGSEDGVIIVIDVRQKKAVAEFSAHSDVVSDLCFCGEDSQRFISCSKDGSIKLFDISGSEIAQFNHSSVNQAWRCLSTDGFELLSGGEDGKLYKWNVADGSLASSLTAHASPMTTIGVSDDGESVVTGSKGGEVIYWDK